MDSSGADESGKSSGVHSDEAAVISRGEHGSGAFPWSGQWSAGRSGTSAEELRSQRSEQVESMEDEALNWSSRNLMSRYQTAIGDVAGANTNSFEEDEEESFVSGSPVQSPRQSTASQYTANNSDSSSVGSSPDPYINLRHPDVHVTTRTAADYYAQREEFSQVDQSINIMDHTRESYSPANSSRALGGRGTSVSFQDSSESDDYDGGHVSIFSDSANQALRSVFGTSTTTTTTATTTSNIRDFDMSFTPTSTGFHPSLQPQSTRRFQQHSTATHLRSTSHLHRSAPVMSYTPQAAQQAPAMTRRLDFSKFRQNSMADFLNKSIRRISNPWDNNKGDEDNNSGPGAGTFAEIFLSSRALSLGSSHHSRRPSKRSSDLKTFKEESESDLVDFFDGNDEYTSSEKDSSPLNNKWIRRLVMTIVFALLILAFASTASLFRFALENPFQSAVLEEPQSLPKVAEEEEGAAVAAAAAAKDKEDSTPSQRYDEMKLHIQAAEVTRPDAFDNPTSPESLALYWITHIDPFHIDVHDEGTLQRFSLAVAFYSFHPDMADQLLNVSDVPSPRNGDTGQDESNVEEIISHVTPWTNVDHWMTEAHVCEWYGVICENDLQVHTLNLTSNELVGTIPPALVATSTLKVLDLSYNKLSGTIPVEVFKINDLEDLCLNDNHISGTLPPHISQMVGAQQIQLQHNKLEGTIPNRIKNLVHLRQLRMDHNKFTGTIVPEIARLSRLELLQLDHNKLSGNLPKGMILKSLQELYLNNNKLTGSFQPDILSMSNLEILNLGHNQLDGSLPDKFQPMQNLTELHLQSNHFDQTLPPSLGELTNLRTLFLDLNRLTGHIPEEWGNMTNLEELTLFDNNLSGEVPTEIGKVTNIRLLHLNSNQFTGRIPTEVGLLVHLQQLLLEENNLTMQVPEEIGNLIELEELKLDANNLTGIIPNTICSLKRKFTLNEISADCEDKVICDCCDYCH